MSPSSNWLPGIDVSHWQGEIAWEQVKTAGIRFAYIKATDGVSGRDSQFYLNQWESEGFLARGAYHFFRMESISAQMDNFKAALGKFTFELPPALDVEVGPFDDAQQRDILLFLNFLEEFSGRIPVLYIDLANAKKITNADFDRYPLWIADYSTMVPTIPGSALEKQWAFWQHTPQGKVSGISNAVDLDWFNGNQVELLNVGKVLPT